MLAFVSCKFISCTRKRPDTQQEKHSETTSTLLHQRRGGREGGPDGAVDVKREENVDFTSADV